MSDVAFVELSSPEVTATGRNVTIVALDQIINSGTEATYAALLSALPFSKATVSGPVSEALLTKFDCDSTGSDKRSVDQAIAGADSVVVVAPHFGADYRTVTRLSRLALRARINGQSLAFVNATADRSAGLPAMLTRIAIRRASLTIMRDEQSADALMASGVEGPLRIGADPAWSELGQLFAAPKRNDEVVVALDDVIDLRDMDRLAGALSPLADAGVGIALQPWTKSGPAVVRAEELANRLSANSAVSVLPAPVSLKEARDTYSTSRAVLALRFHAVMAAACAGSQTVAMGNESLSKLASALDLAVVPTTATASDISAALLQTLNSGPVGSRAVPQLVDRAKATLDLVRLVLTEGEDSAPTANEPLPLYPTAWRQ